MCARPPTPSWNAERSSIDSQANCDAETRSRTTQPSTPFVPRPLSATSYASGSRRISPTTEAYCAIEHDLSSTPPPSRINSVSVSATDALKVVEREADDYDEEDTSLEAGQSSLDWTFELNRLKEISETSMFRGVDSEETTTTTSIAVEQTGEKHGQANEGFFGGTATTQIMDRAPTRRETVKAGGLDNRRYPFFHIYPPVYPVFELYPPALAHDSFLDAASHWDRKDEVTAQFQDAMTRVDALDYKFGATDKVPPTVGIPAYVDPSVDWYHSSTPLERSPASSSCEEDESEEDTSTDSEDDGDGPLGTRYEGTMLTTIVEESYTTSLTVQMAANDSWFEHEEEEVDLPTSELDADDYALDIPRSVANPELPDIPVIVRTRASVSEPFDSRSPVPMPPMSGGQARHRPATLNLEGSFRPVSPVPSPTLKPSHPCPAGGESRSENEDAQVPTPGEALPTSDSGDEFDYDDEELPYLSTPGLREALGFDDSPDIEPFPYPMDESGSEVDSDDGRDRNGRDDEDSDGRLDEGDDSCQTFDHLSPIPEAKTASNAANTVPATTS